LHGEINVLASVKTEKTILLGKFLNSNKMKESRRILDEKAIAAAKKVASLWSDYSYQRRIHEIL
jgi:hypothetical protein